METHLNANEEDEEDGLNRTMQYGNHSVFLSPFVSSQFKSYYVVWKPIFSFFPNTIYLSLNRTMQYGNFEKDENNSSQSFGLNRTMQYGNWLFFSGVKPPNLV